MYEPVRPQCAEEQVGEAERALPTMVNHFKRPMNRWLQGFSWRLYDEGRKRGITHITFQNEPRSLSGKQCSKR